MNYFFNPSTQGNLKVSLSKVNGWQIARSGLEGLIPWKKPGGKLTKAALSAAGDVIANALHSGKSYTEQQAVMDFGLGFISDLAGGELGDLLSKYGAKSVAKGMEMMKLPNSYIKKVTGIDLSLKTTPLSNYTKGSGKTRVGRWMSQAEYDKMVETGHVQMSGDNKVHVANPADIEAFGKQAPKGSIYVEFDVSSNTMSLGGTDGWGIINGPGSLLDRLNAKKGLPRITEMPQVSNIEIKGSK